MHTKKMTCIPSISALFFVFYFISHTPSHKGWTSASVFSSLDAALFPHSLGFSSAACGTRRRFMQSSEGRSSARSRNGVQMLSKSSFCLQSSPLLTCARSPRPAPLSTTLSVRWCRQSPVHLLSVAISWEHRRRRGANRER